MSVGAGFAFSNTLTGVTNVKAVLLSLVLLAGGGFAVPAYAPTRPIDHAAVVWLEFEDGGICSGTMIGVHLLLTAEHCLAEAPLKAINGTETDTLGEPVLDGNDHAIVIVTGSPTGKNFATLGGGLYAGQEVHYWGNPGGIKDLFRRGYVSGTLDGWTLLDVMGWRGDSGAAVFDKHGRIVAVVSTLYLIESFQMIGVKPLAFTRNQLDQMNL